MEDHAGFDLSAHFASEEVGCRKIDSGVEEGRVQTVRELFKGACGFGPGLPVRPEVVHFVDDHQRRAQGAQYGYDLLGEHRRRCPLEHGQSEPLREGLHEHFRRRGRRDNGVNHRRELSVVLASESFAL